MRHGPLRLLMGGVPPQPSCPRPPPPADEGPVTQSTVHIVHTGPTMDFGIHLPPELIRLILQNVEGDGPTTSVCLRVCTEWHERLIGSLYRPLHLHSRSQVTKLLCAARTYPAVYARLAHTRTVAVSQSIDPPLGFDSALWLVLRTRNHCVKHLQFRNCLSEPLAPKLFDTLRQLVSLTRLSLTAFYVGSFIDFKRIICAFPLLRELDLSESRSLTGRPYVRPRSARSTGPSSRVVPRLVLLRIDNLEADFFHDLITWMCPSDACTDIETLHISQRFRSNSDATPVHTLLDHCASSVQHLYLRNTGLGMWPPLESWLVVTLHFWQGLDATIASTSLRASAPCLSV